MKLIYSYIRALHACIATQLYHLNTFILSCYSGAAHRRTRMFLATGILPVAFFCFLSGAFGQTGGGGKAGTGGTVGEITPLSIGDTIPEALWHLPLQVVNHPEGKDTITLSDYRDKKLIILDFWATWCSSCVKNFPSLHALQREVDLREFQILLINSADSRDTKERAEQFLKSQKNNYDLISIVNDPFLKNIFPHRTIPHYVWLSGDRVVALTDTDDLTADNVLNAISGRAIHSSYAAPIPYDSRIPLFENGNGGPSPGYIYRTVLAPYVHGLKSTAGTDMRKDGSISRISFTNARIMNLYRFAYPELVNMTDARIVLDVENSQPFDTGNTTLEWKHNNLYSYECQFPRTVLDEVKSIMREDLDRFFGYSVWRDTVHVDCWIIRASNDRATEIPPDMPSATNLYVNDGRDIYFNNRPVEELRTELENLYGQPFVNETGFTAPVSLELPANLKDTTVLVDSLDSQGIKLFREKRKIGVVVLSDKKY